MADSKLMQQDGNINRFSSKSEQEKSDILEGRNAKNTKRATKSNLKTFLDFLIEKSLPKLEDMDVDTLARVLEDFYVNLKRIDGEDYKLQSIKCIRAGINRWTKANRNLDIISDVCFTRANEMFKGVSKIARETGKGSTKSYPVIEQEDLERIATYFLHDIVNELDPRKLQKCVLFYIIYFFCHRGRENLYDMSINSFEIGTDPDGRQYIYQAIDEMDKNHRYDSTEVANDGKIYEQTGKKLGTCQGVDCTYTVKMLHFVHFWSFACLLIKSLLESTSDVQTADLVLI